MKNLILLAMVFTSFVSFSQVEKGDKEISVFGNLNMPTEGGGGSGTFGLNTSVYLSPHFSFGTSLIMTFYSGLSDPTDPSAGNEIKWTPFIGVFGTYNFITANGKVMPYIGAQVDMSLVETTEFIFTGTEVIPLTYYDGLYFAGGKAGLKIFMTENINFDINLKYQTLIGGPEGYNAGNLGINFGIGVILPRKK